MCYLHKNTPTLGSKTIVDTLIQMKQNQLWDNNNINKYRELPEIAQLLRTIPFVKLTYKYKKSYRKF